MHDHRFLKKGFLFLETFICIFLTYIIMYISGLLTTKLIHSYIDQKRYSRSLCMIENHLESLRANKTCATIIEKIDGIDFTLSYTYQAEHLQFLSDSGFRTGDDYFTVSSLTVSWLAADNTPKQITIWI